MSSHSSIETVEHLGYTIEIHYDEDGSFANPRDWDNLGTIICWHHRYDLSDKDRPDDGPSGEPTRLCSDYTPSDFLCWAKANRAIVENIYMMDHSSISLSTGRGNPYAAYDPGEWDSGQVGFIYVLPETIRKEYKVKSINQHIKRRVLDILHDEVKLYGEYVNGEVFFYSIKDSNNEHVDSCGGYIGYDGIKNAIDDAKHAIECMIASHNTENAMAERYMVL